MDRPLQGVRVVEVAMWVAGPSTTAVLGDWGADVIKLEDPVTGDPIRGFVTRTMGDPNARSVRHSSSTIATSALSPLTSAPPTATHSRSSSSSAPTSS